MKAKTTKFICDLCGYESAKWYGKCPGCGEWNCLSEQTVSAAPKSSAVRKFSMQAEPVALKEISFTPNERIDTQIDELNRVLGGGLVPGSMVLICGEPGIGKSTLLLQLCDVLNKQKVLYVSGEESLGQIKMRAERLNLSFQDAQVLCHTNIDDITELAQKIGTKTIIIDSIQTMYAPDISSIPGSVSQVRECAMRLMQLSKQEGITILLVGHVTKDGGIAGPRILEHMVDCVLYFEGERHLTYRILRATKNRFGSTNEIGVFEMVEEGLKEVLNPSSHLLEGRPEGTSGTAITCVLEGTRPILIEVQALITQPVFSNPRRTCTGFDWGRASMLIAVAEKRLGIPLNNRDIYINITGGLRISDPAADMAVILAILSSFKDMPLAEGTVAVGEIGLTGEVRTCGHLDRRIMESEKLGFSKILIPSYNKLKGFEDKKIEIFKAANIERAAKLLF